MRALEESAQLERQLADRATLRNDRVTADRFNDIARDREVQASTIRNMLLWGEKQDDSSVSEERIMDRSGGIHGKSTSG